MVSSSPKNPRASLDVINNKFVSRAAIQTKKVHFASPVQGG